MSIEKNLLSCWHRLEHYNPSDIKINDSKNIELNNQNNIPWNAPILDFDKGP